MEVHICNNCKYTEKCNQRYNNSFLYCICNNIQIRDTRNNEFLSESMILSKEDKFWMNQ